MHSRMKALVLGGARCVWEDYDAALRLFKPDVIIGINDIAIHVPEVDHWVSMHPDKFPMWMDMRAKNTDRVPTFWTSRHKKKPLVFNYPIEEVNSRGGGSGLLATRVAMFLGSQQIVLAGVPLKVEEAHFFNDKPWTECMWYRRGFEKCPAILPYVRSMSGWTREFFGFPDDDFLNRDLSMD